jgi:hypothetical protein
LREINCIDPTGNAHCRRSAFCYRPTLQPKPVPGNVGVNPICQRFISPVYPFADWPNLAVPIFGAGVYTIWHNDGRFIYVGMSGRGITAETTRRNTPQGIYTRLQSHASGRRSGDQFCVYVADRLVLPILSLDDITAIASGHHQMDAFVRRYIHENVCYRFVMLPDGAAAYALEAAIKGGKWEHGRPLLNPGR